MCPVIVHRQGADRRDPVAMRSVPIGAGVRRKDDERVRRERRPARGAAVDADGSAGDRSGSLGADPQVERPRGVGGGSRGHRKQSDDHDADEDGAPPTLNRHVEPVFNPDAKEHHWGKRKLKRDQ